VPRRFDFLEKNKIGDNMVVSAVPKLTIMNISGDDPWRAAMAGTEKRVATIGKSIDKPRG
jgi:hypothetical protein